jgi:DUF1009 family protein
LTYTPEFSLLKGVHTKTKPSSKDKDDIDKAISTLSRLNNYSFSQGAVVRDNKVLAVEGNNGTQYMLQKIKKKQNISKGVLVKFPKKKQDLRIDLPTIGINTLKQCKKAGLNGVVLKNKKNICLDKKKLINFANKNKIFIAAL